MIIDHSETRLAIKTPKNRSFLIVLAGDPDVRIQEVTPSGLLNRLSIEVKGGMDKSNAYNRGGEAAKSHQSARRAGYQECWTIISMSDIALDKLKGGSPTTDVWFETAHIVTRAGDDWLDFQGRVRSLLGL